MHGFYLGFLGFLSCSLRSRIEMLDIVCRSLFIMLFCSWAREMPSRSLLCIGLRECMRLPPYCDWSTNICLLPKLRLYSLSSACLETSAVFFLLPIVIRHICSQWHSRHWKASISRTSPVWKHCTIYERILTRFQYFYFWLTRPERYKPSSSSRS
jgi:hypothetical protein